MFQIQIFFVSTMLSKLVGNRYTVEFVGG